MRNGMRTPMAVLAAGALMVVVMAGPVAYAGTTRLLTVEVTPATTTAFTPTEFEVRVTNHASSTKPLGAAEITLAAEGRFADISVTSVEGPAGKSWSLDSVMDSAVRVSADGSQSTLSAGQFVTVKLQATPPNNSGGDTIYDVEAVGRQATDFSDADTAPGNTFVESEDVVRPGTFEYRDADGGTTYVTLRSDQVLVTGIAVDCSVDCSGQVTQFETTVTVSADCGDGTLIIDTQISDLALEEGQAQVGASAYYDYFGACPPGTIVTVDFAYTKTADTPSVGAIEFAADYDGLLPGYIDGSPFPNCKQDVTSNCVVFVKGGGTEITAEILMVLIGEDPVGWGYN